MSSNWPSKWLARSRVDIDEPGERCQWCGSVLTKLGCDCPAPEVEILPDCPSDAWEGLPDDE
jgi:hypothetical protein